MIPQINPPKSQNNNAHTANELEIVPSHQDCCLHSHKHSSQTTYSQCRKLSQLCYPSLTLNPKKLNFSKTCSKKHQNVPPPYGNRKNQLFPLALKRKHAPNVLQHRRHQKNLGKLMTAFKRRFVGFQSSAKARCEWDALHFEPAKFKFHEFLDILQTTAENAFGSDAQKVIDKAIYAKMPDHVKKILNRAYL